MTSDMPHSDEAVAKNTGKTWTEWRAIIDVWGGADKSHTEIAAWLVDEQGLSGWWAQGVTVGYERAIGRREVGQRNDGFYSASASKTIQADAKSVHSALVDDEQRRAWLGDGIVAFRTASGTKSARFDDLEADVIIAFFLTDKGEKTSVQVQGEKFTSQDDADTWKMAWKARLNELARRYST